MNTRIGSVTRSFIRRPRFHRPYLESLEQRLPPGDTLALLLGGAASLDSLDHSSFPNTGSGTYFRETPFRVGGEGETEFREGGVPEREFGNEIIERTAPSHVSRPSSDDPLDLDWIGNDSAKKRRIVSNPEFPNRPLFVDGGSLVAAPGNGRIAPHSAVTLAVAGRSPTQATSNAEAPATATEQSADGTATQQSQVQENYGRLPISFEANHGQVDEQVDFIARGAGYSMFLTPTEAVMVLSQGSGDRGQGSAESMLGHGLPAVPTTATVGGETFGRASGHGQETVPEQDVPEQDAPPAVVRMQFVGANPAPQVTGKEQLPGIVNYFIGNDPTKWRTDIPTFAKVEYDEVYPGIDLVYYGNADRQLEYDFVVAPGADPRAITLNFAGADKLELDAAGDLIVHAGDVELRQHKPVLYQEANGARQQVAGDFVLSTQHSALSTFEVHFEVGAYDANRPLVVDPTWVYSSYLGGSGSDRGLAIALDSAGNAYVTGWTFSTNFPTENPVQANHAGGGPDVFLTKVNATGTAKVYSTYLGGGREDEGKGVAVDSAGNAYVTGSTNSTNFPTQNPFQPVLAGGLAQDVFVTKVNAAGSALVYSTYLGGAFSDFGYGIAVDSTGNAYVTGAAGATDFPLMNPFQPDHGESYDAFVTKFNAAGDGLVYSTFLGGNGTDEGKGIAVDSTGSAYVSGVTYSSDFPTQSAYQPALSEFADAFVTKFFPSGTFLYYSTYLGGSHYDYGYAIAVDSAGNANVTGETLSTNFPTKNALQANHAGGDRDAFLTKVNASGSALVYSTYLGGSGDDHGNAIAVDSAGNGYVTGETKSTDFPTKNPVQANSGGFTDVFVSEVNAAGTALVYSTYLGGNNAEFGFGIAVPKSCGPVAAYVTGQAGIIPTTPGAFQSTYGGGGSDAFVTKIPPGNAPSTLPFEWTAKGPAPILGGQTPGDQAVSGRIAGIAPHPTDPNVIYVAAASGGVWKTIDAGVNWTPLTDMLPLVPVEKRTLVTGAIAVAPSNPDVIYAGTGEACNATNNCYYGRGILKSTDAGATWNLLGNAEFDRRTISRIVVHPTISNIVYAAVADNGFIGVADNAGIWKTEDGGTTWTNTTLDDGIAHDADASDLVMDPISPVTLYAAIGEYNGHDDNGVYKSTDGGGEWTRLGGSVPKGVAAGRIKLAIAPSNSQVVYAAVTGSGQAGSSAFGTLHRLLRTGNGGLRWRNMTNTPNYMGQQGFYDSTLAVSPLNSNHVYAGGQSDIIRSSNGGGSWEYLNIGANGNGPHADHHAMAFDAGDRLLDGNDGGLWRLDNAETGSILWTDLNGTGVAGTTALQITQFNGIALHPTDPNIAYGGSQDNGTEKTTGSKAWTHIGAGDGGFVRVDCSNPNTVYHTFQYAEGTFTDFFERSDDAGATWQTKTTGLDSTNKGNFYIPYVMDPSNPSRLLLGTDRVYETIDKADNWTVLGSFTFPLPINSLEAAASDVNTIYATSAGGIYRTVNHGASWQSIDIPNAADHVGDLLIDPLDSKVLYAARDRFDDFDSGHVFRTTDGGSNWNDITGNLPDVPANALALDPRTEPDTLYVGTDLGVYVSTNLGSSWQVFKTGLPPVMVRELELNQQMNILAAGTYGRGLWEIGIALPPAPPPPAPPADGRSALDVARPAPAGAVFMVGNLEPIFRPVRPSEMPAWRNTDVVVAVPTVTLNKPSRAGYVTTKTFVTAVPDDKWEPLAAGGLTASEVDSINV